jgi:hypothetical protein
VGTVDHCPVVRRPEEDHAMTRFRTVRRLALAGVAALAILPSSAVAASAQSAEDLCALRDEAPDEFAPLLDALEPLVGAFCDDGGADGGDDGAGDEGDGGDGGPTGTPLDDLLEQIQDADPGVLEELLGALPVDELCGLREQAPEEFAPLLDALAPVLDAICGEDDGDGTEEEDATGGDDDTASEADADADEDEGVVAPSTAPTLPNTGGGAALAGLALLGAAGAIRRVVGPRGRPRRPPRTAADPASGPPLVVVRTGWSGRTGPD